MDLAIIKQRLSAGNPLSDAEAAFLIRYDMPSLAAFMIENNPGSVNFALRNKLGYNHLGFAPDQKALARQLEIFIERNNKADFQEVVRNFRMDASKLPEKLVIELRKQFANVS